MEAAVDALEHYSNNSNAALWTSETDRSTTAPWKTLRVSHSYHSPHHQGYLRQDNQPEQATP